MKTYKDVFVEELVVRRRPVIVGLIKLAVVLLGIVLTLLFYFLCGMLLGQYSSALFPALFAIVCIAVFLTFRFLGVEYEYSFYSGEVDIEKILGKRKRSTVMSFSCRNVELMAPYSEKYDAELEGVKPFDARGIGAGDKDWIVVVKTDNEEKKVLAFSPSARMQEAFRQYVRAGKFKED